MVKSKKKIMQHETVSLVKMVKVLKSHMLSLFLKLCQMMSFATSPGVEYFSYAFISWLST